MRSHHRQSIVKKMKDGGVKKKARASDKQNNDRSTKRNEISSSIGARVVHIAIVVGNEEKKIDKVKVVRVSHYQIVTEEFISKYL